jgi:hypothetical protein
MLPYADVCVSATANYVFHCTPHICPLTMSSPIRALDCLAEFVQHPCRPNQRVLADTGTQYHTYADVC